MRQPHPARPRPGLLGRGHRRRHRRRARPSSAAQRAARDAALLRLATEVEGHPDNVAACLLGGFTLSWTEATRRSAAPAVRIDAHPDLAPVAFVPETSRRPKVREAAAGTVPHADAAANAAPAALLVEALTRRPELLLPADRRPAAPAVPRAGHAGQRGAGRAAAGRRVPAVISGAGPTVLALADPGRRRRGARPGAAWAAPPLALDAGGASVLPLS